MPTPFLPVGRLPRSAVRPDPVTHYTGPLLTRPLA